MNDICVRAEHLSKRFLVIKRRETLLRVLRAIIGREHLKRQLWALHGISFEVKKGDRLALIGKNGSGKTTLLRILAGIYDKTGGTVHIAERPLALFKLSIGLNANLCISDNIYLLGSFHGIPEEVLRRNEHAILRTAGLEDFQYVFLKNLSSGQQQRLALSVFFQARGSFVMIDESMAFVDMGFARIYDEYFKTLISEGTTLIMASHDMDFLKRYCTKALWLDEGRIRGYGEIAGVAEEYKKSLARV